MRISLWRVNNCAGLRYSVESHAIAYPRMHPAMLQRGFHAPACQRMHPAMPQRGFHTPTCQRMHPAMPQRGFHTPTCQRAPWQLRYTPVFDPKPSWNNPCPPATISSHLRSQNMPQTRHQNHPTINPKSLQSRNKPNFHIHTNFIIHPQRGRFHTPNK